MAKAQGGYCGFAVVAEAESMQGLAAADGRFLLSAFYAVIFPFLAELFLMC